MEYFLHLSYRLEIKKWQVRGQNVQAMKIRKNQIQKRFKVETGLIVDKPKPGGSGTSNDGNTARRFFSDPKKTAAITGLDVTALERCGTILQVIKWNTEKPDVHTNNTIFLGISVRAQNQHGTVF